MPRHRECERTSAKRKDEINWLVPPPSLIIDCLDKLKAEHVQGVILIPKWTTASFWPTFVKRKEELFKEIIILDNSEFNYIIIPGRGCNKSFLERKFQLLLCVLRHN